MSTDQLASNAATATLKQAYRTIRSLQQEVDDLRRPIVEPIAVIGMGCRLPGGADGTAAYWDLLRSGTDAVVEVPRKRFDVEPYYDPERGARGKTRTRWGGFVGDLDAFDHAFFGISLREAESMDPQQRLALETAWLALEEAQLPAESLAGSRTGVYLGVSSSDYAMEGSREPGDITAYSSSGTAHSVVPGRISYVLNLRGPALAIDTACSSSLVAIHQACQALRAGECDVALSGGVNVVMSPLPSIAFSAFGMMSGDGRARAFDEKGDGCVRGEGAGIVVLKRLSDARRDGDDVLALVVGNAVNQDGRSSGFTAPSAESQAACVRQALDRAGVAPGDVQFVECHGTGTPLGDPIEVEALASVYGAEAGRCFLGSAKTTISHLEAAAGVAGFIKAVLALRHGTVPPNLHFDRLNPNISFEGTSFAVPTQPEPWPAPVGARHAAVSAFGFSGTNAHVVLAEGPVRPEVPAAVSSARTDEPTVLVLSARSATALNALADRYRTRLVEGEDLRALAHAAATGRSHLPHRLAILADEAPAAIDRLEAFVEGWPTDHAWWGTAKDRPLAFVFSGQGAEYAGMARDLHEREPVFAEALDRCADVLGPHLPRPLLEVMWPGAEGDQHLIHAMTYAQPGLFAVEYALSRLWEAWGVTPGLVMGHSIGELCAATVAGVLDVEDALPFVALRGSLLDRVPGGGMGAIGLPAADVEPFLAEHPGVGIAARNSPSSVTVSGPAAAVATLCATLAERGVRTKILPVTTAAHSRLVEPLVDELVAAARLLSAGPPRIPLVSNVTGRPWDWTRAVQPEYWGEHLRRPVDFEAGMRTASDLGFTTFLEVGPAPRLSAAIAETLDDAPVDLVPSLRPGHPDRPSLLSSAARLHVGGSAVSWSAVLGPRRPGAVALPAYPFDRTPCPMAVDRSPRLVASPGVPSPRPVETLYCLVWNPGRVESVTPAAQDWLVVGDEASEVAAVLGERARVVHEDDLPAAFASATAGTLVLWMPEPGDHGESGAALVADTAALTARGAALLRHVGAHGDRVSAWFLTRGGVALEGDDTSPAGVAHAGLWGQARAMEQELARGWGGIIDLDPGAPLAGQVARAVEAGLFHAGETQLALRTEVLIPRLVPAEPSGTALPLRPDATYVVSGGFGGLGSATCDWLVTQGARHLAVLSRTGLPPREEWADQHDAATTARISVVRRLEAAGASVRCAAVDVTDQAAVSAWFERHRRECRPEVRGIVHAAGIGGVVPLAGVDAAVVRRHVAAKLAGAWHLATGCPADQLDFVLLYSSLAAVLSAPFTSAYAAANSAMDRLAATLRGRGVAVQSVNWGLWDGVGLAGDRNPATLGRGVHPLEPGRALATLPVIIGSGLGQATVVDIAWAEWAPTYASATRSRVLDDLVTGRRQNGHDLLPTRAEVLALPEDKREGVLCERLLRAVSETLGNSAAMKADSSLFDLGMDSLMAVELRNRVERRLEVRVPVATFLGGASVEALAGEVARSIAAPARVASITPARRDEGAIGRILAQAAAGGTNQGVES